jgi:hypothetical protein
MYKDKIINYSIWISVAVLILMGTSLIWIEHRTKAEVGESQQKAAIYLTVVKSNCKLVGTGITFDSAWTRHSADVYECIPGQFRIINTHPIEDH